MELQRRTLPALLLLVAASQFGCGGSGSSPNPNDNPGNPTAPQFQDPGFEANNIASGAWLQNAEVTGTPWTGDSNWGIADMIGPWGRFGRSSAQYAFIQASNTNEVSSHGAIRQTVTGLTVGQNYRVKFWISCRNGTDIPKSWALVTLLANGVQIMEPTSPTTTGSWREVSSQTFTATQTSYEFTIQSILPQFPENTATLIDEVRLEVAP